MKILLQGSLYFFPFIIFLISCTSVKKITYFNDLQADSTLIVRELAPYLEPRIQPDDIIQISVHTLDPESSSVVNQVQVAQAVGASSATNTGNQQISGFLVDKEGFVHMSLLGKVKVGGLTTTEARNVIRELAAEHYNNPNIDIRFTNFKITVLGEVARPASYVMPNEKVSVLDALGLAGDLTIYGKRDNILLIREVAGKKEMVRLNLNDSWFISSPYFYLRQNDVIYVEPGKAKAAANNAARTQTIAIIGSTLSVIMVALTRIN